MRNRRRHHPIGAEPVREVVHEGALYEVGGRIAPYLELMDRDAAAGAAARHHLRAVEIAGDQRLIHPDQRPLARRHGGDRRTRNPGREIEHLCRRRSASREQQRRRGREPMPLHRRLSDLPVISALGLRSRYSAISRSERAAPSICCTRPRISASRGERSPTCRSIVASVCPVWSISRFVDRTVSFRLAISASERAPRRSSPAIRRTPDRSAHWRAWRSAAGAAARSSLAVSALLAVPALSRSGPVSPARRRAIYRA